MFPMISAGSAFTTVKCQGAPCRVTVSEETWDTESEVSVIWVLAQSFHVSLGETKSLNITFSTCKMGLKIPILLMSWTDFKQQDNK